ncbi:MAG: ATPase domain-containing protein [bacterium]
MNITSHTTEWGLPYFDRQYNGLPVNSFNMLETSDSRLGLLAIAKFLIKGIQMNENVVLVTFDDPEKLIEKFASMGFNLQNLIYMEKLFILSYKETFSRSLNISTDYKGLFDEAKNLTNPQASRIAFLNANLLFNLESSNLATMSASKLTHAARSVGLTVLAQYTSIEGQAYQNLKQACHSMIDCYVSIYTAENKKLALKVNKTH